jgi:hypothetical protein
VAHLGGGVAERAVKTGGTTRCSPGSRTWRLPLIITWACRRRPRTVPLGWDGNAADPCVGTVELLGYLEAHGFSNYIVSGSDGDFMRSIAQEVFGIPPERVIGSGSALE